MYSYSLRAASSGNTGLGFALGRFGGTRGGGVAALGLVAPVAASSRGRSVSATSAANSPVPGDQGVGMEQPRQGADRENARDDMHKATRDVMTISFGEAYSTRSDDEGFGGVYGRNNPVEHPGTEIHPSHPEDYTSQGSEVKEEMARHLKDEKHAT
ncbi:uncharacterized protein LOC133915555 [Phragmites australis]|uniref:uncharacterized protein LOC133915555 n=1 Tax=Phragmites australis TaxID=29695 RepID=UPI002D76F90F|nr:uncharacterized protein LOC133915555 [Phragmites australis]